MTNESMQKRQDANKKLVLDQLKKTPIVQIVCERCGIGKTTYYRWRQEDTEFKKDSDEAMQDGIDLINDLSESQLIALIKEKNFPAIQLWLRQHHPAYSNRMEVTARIVEDETLTPEQEALVKEMLGIKSKPITEK